MIFSFIRISTFLTVCKSIFPPGTPNTFKVLFSLMLSGMVSINLGLNIEVNNMYTLISCSITELLNGLFLGYVTYLALNTVQIAGSLIDNQMGLSMASVYDPASGSQSTLMQRLFYWIAIVLLFVTNGHHLLLNSIFHSFEMIPIGTLPIVDNFQYTLKLFVGYFGIAFQIALPIVLTLIMSELILGLISRSVPQLNVMIIGMPLKLLIGVVIVLISSSFLVNELQKIISNLPKILNGYM